MRGKIGEQPSEEVDLPLPKISELRAPHHEAEDFRGLGLCGTREIIEALELFDSQDRFLIESLEAICDRF